MLDQHRRIANEWMRIGRIMVLLNQSLVVGTVLLSSGLAVYASKYYSDNVIIALSAPLIAVLVALQQFYGFSRQADRYLEFSGKLLNAIDRYQFAEKDTDEAALNEVKLAVMNAEKILDSDRRPVKYNERADEF